jgi:hypothetical protein
LMYAISFANARDEHGLTLAGGHDQETDILAEDASQLESQSDARDRLERVSEHETVGYGNT